MERFNGTFRYHELAFKNLKKIRYAFDRWLSDILQLYKKHIGLGKTPVEVSNINVQRINKLLTLIQNASLHTYQ